MDGGWMDWGMGNESLISWDPALLGHSVIGWLRGVESHCPGWNSGSFDELYVLLKFLNLILSTSFICKMRLILQSIARRIRWNNTCEYLEQFLAYSECPKSWPSLALWTGKYTWGSWSCLTSVFCPPPLQYFFSVWCDCIYLWSTVTNQHLFIYLLKFLSNQFIVIVILLYFLPRFCFVFASIHSGRNAELKSKAPIFIVNKSNTDNNNNYPW